MGGNATTPSGVSQSTASDVQAAVEGRIAEIAAKGQSIVIGCEPADMLRLTQLVGAVPVGSIGDVHVVSTQAEVAAVDLSGASLVISFSDVAKTFEFVNGFVRTAALSGKLGFHAKGQASSTLPASVGTYRWRVYLWDEAVKILT